MQPDIAEEITTLFFQRKIDTIKEKIPQALPQLEQVVKKNPTDDKAQFALFLCYLIQERGKEALAAISQAYTLSPSNPVYAMEYSVTLKMNGDVAKAREIADKASAQQGRPASIEIMIATLDKEMQHYQDAETRYIANLKRIPSGSMEDKSVILSSLGDIYLHQAKYDKAKAVLQQAISALPNNLGAKALLGESLLKSGNIIGGIKLFDEVLQANPDFWLVIYLKGVALQKLKHPAEAKARFTRALQIGLQHSVKDNGRDQFTLGKIYFYLDDKRRSAQYTDLARRLGYTYEPPFAR